ncbi:hypothetical protein HOP52_11990 [Halomonas campisalis]|uniref:AsmA-like C-terminal domain-containing protein n=1 Tax=Billgrantia campisalis TaxID=74661 RepID=A0ABS9P9L5_9GAMM|nr:hypothetical protein [Halomonas campisalis]MCG6658474.1 hypothetical protein [Halomonas campisalis]MDR5863334.1 hypothetical protein [Halomonas campisalis]
MAPTNGPPPRRLRRWPLRLAASLALLALLYLAGLNLLLNSAWTQAWLDRHLPQVSVSWHSGWSLWPGRLRLEGLVIERHDEALPLTLAVDEAELRLATAGLFSRRLRVQRLEASGLRRLAVGEHRLQGDGELRLDALSLAEARISVDSLALTLSEGSLWRDDTLLAEALSLTADLSVAPFAPAQGLHREQLAPLSGELRLAGRADAWDVFTPYLAATPWLALAGSGALSGELTLRQGVLAEGSHLGLDAPALAVTLDESALLGDEAEAVPRGRHRLAGRGRASLQVSAEGDAPPAPRLDVHLDDVTMQPLHEDDPAPLLTSRRFALSAHLPSADLTAPPQPPDSARLSWQAAEVADVGRLARYLPPGSPLRLHGGSARLDAELNYRHGRFDGRVDLSGETVALTLLEQRLQGELTLGLNLAELDPQARRLDLSGTQLRVAATPAGESTPMVTDLRLPTAHFSTRRPLDELADREGPPPLDGELTVTGRVTHLAFLNAFLEEALDGRGMTLDGEGELDARLVLDNGRPSPESRLTLSAPRLEARFLGFHAHGRGTLSSQLRETRAGAPGAELEVRLEAAQLSHGQDPRPLLVAPTLTLAAQLASLDTPEATTLRLAWPDASIPDVAVLGQHLPPSAPLALLGGRAESRGELLLEADGLSGELALSGRALRARLLDTEIEGELSLALPVRHAHLDGSRLDLSGARPTLLADSPDSAQPLSTLLVARQARFDHPFGGAQPPHTRLVLDGLVERLGFLDRFLPAAHGVTLRGSGQLQADLDLLGQAPRPGSRLQVDAERLTATFLDYRVVGGGRLEAHLEGDPEAPAGRLSLSLPRLSLGRRDGSTTYLSGRHFHLETTTPHFALAPGAIPLDALTTRIELPVAEVEDLADYQAYLPAGAGLALLGGRASLTAELELVGAQARGDLTLQAFDASLRIGEQQLVGNLRLEARLREGNLNTLRFDAAGSRLRLDNVSRRGLDGQRERGWWAQLDLEAGQLTWQQPLSLEARLALSMRDSGLLANLVLAGSGERPRLGRLLTVPDIRGHTRLRLSDDGLHLDELTLTGRGLELLANLRLVDESLQGVLYARYGAGRLGLALEDGGRELQLFRPRRWYDSAAEAQARDPRQPLPSDWRQAIDTVISGTDD